MDDRVDQRVVLQFAELDDVARVEENDDLFEMLLDVFDQLFLSVGQLEVMILRSIFESAVFTRRAHAVIDIFHGKVCAFAAETADHDERSIVVAVVCSLDRRGIIGEIELLILVRRNRPLCARTERTARILLIQGFQLRVDVQALCLEGRINICAFFELAGAGTRAAVAECVGVDTEHADIFHIRVRQLVLRAVFAAAVLEQDRALAGDLNVFGFGRFFQLFIAGERRIVMTHAVIAMAHLVFLCDLRNRKGRYRRKEQRAGKYYHEQLCANLSADTLETGCLHLFTSVSFLMDRVWHPPVIRHVKRTSRASGIPCESIDAYGPAGGRLPCLFTRCIFVRSFSPCHYSTAKIIFQYHRHGAHIKRPTW